MRLLRHFWWLTDRQRVTWAAFAILAMFYIYDDCNIFAGNRTHWSSTGSPVGMGSPQSGKLTLKRKRHHADQTTNTKYKEDMRVQIFAVYVITTAISARSQWPFSIKLSWQNIFSFLTGSYVAKTGKMSLWLDSQRWISIKPPFCNFWANLVSFCSCNYLKNALCL